MTDLVPDQRNSSLAPEHLSVTRHLCAGVYSDRAIRDLVIRVHNTAHRRVAPSYDFDLVPVIRHAWAARALEAGGHAALAAAIVIPLLLGRTWSAVLVALALLACVAVHIEMRRVKKVVRQAVDDSSHRTRSKWKWRVRGTSQQTPLLDRQVAGFWNRIPLRFRRYLKAGAATAALLVGSSILHPAETAFATHLFLGLLGVTATLGALRQHRINRLRTRSDPRPSRLTPREKAVHEQQLHAFVVYCRDDSRSQNEDELRPFNPFGHISPFIGAGEIIHHWNPPMTVQMLRPANGEESRQDREYGIPPFKAHELVHHLRHTMTKLHHDSEDVRLQSNVRDRIYISEADASADRWFLHRSDDVAEIESIINTPDHKAHHFLEVSVPAVGGELVTTVLLRVSLKGRTLSLDFAACALPRTPAEYRRIGRYAEHGIIATILSALRTVRAFPEECTRIYRLAALPLLVAQAVFAQRDWTLAPMPGILIGSKVAVREECAEEWGDVQIDKTKILDHMKIVEQHLLNSIHDFLDSRKVDTSDFDKRATQIISASVVNVGGVNEFTNSAIGTGAQANNVQPQAPRNQ
ncbi:hypothetical protein ACFQZ2_00345 [Streptomonospora algeriensis]|uniref:Uncharacterized protein n=1 Tax=Streptomonospora algeriensis TaxID=995084 RepID=A0ABW3B8U2_9ACTN